MISTQRRLELDRKAQLDYARDIGFKKGFEIGFERGLAIALSKPYQLGHSIEEIADFFGMTIDEVNHYLDIAQTMNK